MENFFMTTKEAERFRLLKNYADNMISLVEISNILDISYRQTKRLWKAFRIHGASGLISKKRNNQNHSLDCNLEQTILSIIEQRYHDYGPTLISEKLKENYNIKISKETIRKIMIKHGLHKPKKQKKIKIYQRRKRRSCFGELVQMDGSPHNWFEGRGPYCTLLLAVDDATGNLLAGRFELTETTEGYFRLMENYLEQYGRPVCLYTDKYGSFRVNHGKDRSKPTQFARAMRELNIKMIAAHSPQAKGRIERANGILQDRLVKELRERGISTIEEANLFLPYYFKKHNKRFGKEPAASFNAHSPLNNNQDLNNILCNKETRKISKNMEINYKNEIYQIQEPNRINSLRGVSVQVIEKANGDMLIEYKGNFLNFVWYEELEKQPQIVDHKELVVQWERTTRKNKPNMSHPWRKSMNF